MTRDKAIESLTWVKENLVIAEEYKEALNMAIEALKQEPVVRCKDCISKPNQRTIFMCLRQ